MNDNKNTAKCIIGIFLFSCAIVTVWQWTIFFIVFGGAIYVTIRASLWKICKEEPKPTIKQRKELPSWQTSAKLICAKRSTM